MEFIPRPFQILERAINAPDRWAKRIAPFVDDAAFAMRSAFPGLKKTSNVKGVPFGKAAGPLSTAVLTGMDIAGGEEPWKAAGRNVSGLVGGLVAAPIAEAIPIPGTSIPGYMVGDQLGRTAFNKAIDDRGISGLLQGKGWNNPFGSSSGTASSGTASSGTASSGTGMANLPVDTKEVEIALSQKQGGYLPSGMGVPAQVGGGQRFNLGGKGGSNWVGGNSTWVDKNDNVLAPHVSDVFSDHQNSNVFTPHYETGEPLGVMTRNQRRAYEEAAAAAGF